jgi:aminoglycoside 3-N-acetyltransferase
MDGKIAALDLADEQCMTFYHFVEESENVPYRYHKTFKGMYTGRSDSPTPRTFGLFVRDLAAGVETDVSRMGELLWQQGACKGCRPGQADGLRTLRAAEMFMHTRAVIRSGQALNMLYRISSDSIPRTLQGDHP